MGIEVYVAIAIVLTFLVYILKPTKSEVVYESETVHADSNEGELHSDYSEEVPSQDLKGLITKPTFALIWGNTETDQRRMDQRIGLMEFQGLDKYSCSIEGVRNS